MSLRAFLAFSRSASTADDAAALRSSATALSFMAGITCNTAPLCDKLADDAARATDLPLQVQQSQFQRRLSRLCRLGTLQHAELGQVRRHVLQLFARLREALVRRLAQQAHDLSILRGRCAAGG